jgi:hypothetical protein
MNRSRRQSLLVKLNSHLHLFLLPPLLLLPLPPSLRDRRLLCSSLRFYRKLLAIACRKVSANPIPRSRASLALDGYPPLLDQLSSTPAAPLWPLLLQSLQHPKCIPTTIRIPLLHPLLQHRPAKLLQHLSHTSPLAPGALSTPITGREFTG